MSGTIELALNFLHSCSVNDMYLIFMLLFPVSVIYLL